MFYGQRCAHSRLNGLKQVKDETPIIYPKAEIRTQVVVICDPMCYQLDHTSTQEKEKRCVRALVI